MAIHYAFEGPLDVSLMLRGIVHDIESRTVTFQYGPQSPIEGEFDVAIGALREAADKIEMAVYAASKKT